jgi:hypothetical protein
MLVRRARKCLSIAAATEMHCRRASSSKQQNTEINLTPPSYGPCSVLEWAALPENRAVAAECLDVPSTATHKMTSFDASKISNWEEYWTQRQWSLPNQLKNDTEREHGQALATHVMTAPMTIISMLKPLLEVCEIKNNKKMGTSVTKVKWCCLGARSEASLPIQFWQEMIDLIHAKRRVMINVDARKSYLLDISLDFIGPEMNPQPDITLQQSALVPHGEYDFVTSKALTTRCTIRWRYKGMYHEYFNKNFSNIDLFDKQYDSYILFNPGVGHPNLQSSWQPTLQLLFEQYYRINSLAGCCLILTAHSALDAERDSRLLQQYISFSYDTTTIDCDYEIQTTKYTENPFASRIYYHDPIVPPGQDHPHILHPNQYIAIFDKY